MTSLLDVVVVGGGFAGASAALTLGRARHPSVLFRTGPTRNAKAHAANGFSTQEGVRPGDILKRSLDELKKYEATLSVREVGVSKVVKISVDPEPTQFEVHLEDGTHVASRKVILATGVHDDLPAVEGLEAIWGRKAHVCPYCDGFEYGTTGRLGVLENGPNTFHLVNMLAQQWTPNITLFASNDFLTAVSPDGKPAPALHPNITVMPRASSVRWSGADTDPVVVHEANGKELATVDGIFGPTIFKPQSQLAKDLGAELNPMGFIIVSPEFETSVAGLSAVGDVSWPRGGKMPTARIPEAMGSGARAAGWISASLILEGVAGAIAATSSTSTQ